MFGILKASNEDFSLNNNLNLKKNLDLIDEAREMSYVREYTIETRDARKYNSKVIARDMKEGVFALRRSMGPT